MFRTQFQPHERVRSGHGDPIKILYTPEFDKKGVMNLVESGRENLYDFIQSHADSVDIHVILKRFQDGDASVLSRVQGAYGDFTQMPKTYAEMLNSLIAAENAFNALPVDERAKYGHSFQRWLSEFNPSPSTTDSKSSDSIQVPPVETIPSKEEVKA